MRRRLNPAIAALAMFACLSAQSGVATQPGSENGLVVLPIRTIPAGSIIGPDDVVLQPVSRRPAADMVQSLAAAVGKETRRSLYADRPVRAHEVGPITLVERNARVTLRFRSNAMELSTIGRALEAGGMGQIIRVMNLDSRRTIYGRISGPEVVDVGS